MANRRVTSAELIANPANFLALGAGTGMAPVAPGTFGTLGAIVVLLVMPTNAMIYAAIVALMFVVGVWLCDTCAKNLAVHDHPAIVWDEWVGYLVTMFMVPRSFWLIALGFVLFRLFDILKPWPIGMLDKQVDGGMGIMLDDVVAGVFAAISIQLILFVLGLFGVSLAVLGL